MRISEIKVTHGAKEIKERLREQGSIRIETKKQGNGISNGNGNGNGLKQQRK
jgi:hypothetical protein